jgi:small conductance mechanosensitive channel
VRNHSALPVRRAQWTLPLAPQDDLRTVEEALRATVLEDPRILAEPAPALHLQEWTQVKMELAVSAWTVTENFLAVQQELLDALALRVLELRRPAVPLNPVAIGPATSPPAPGT